MNCFESNFVIILSLVICQFVNFYIYIFYFTSNLILIYLPLAFNGSFLDLDGPEARRPHCWGCVHSPLKAAEY